MSGTQTVGELALELMERLTADYGDDPKVGTVAVIAEVETEQDGETATTISYRCTDPRRWVQIGLFEAAQRAALSD